MKGTPQFRKPPFLSFGHLKTLEIHGKLCPESPDTHGVEPSECGSVLRILPGIPSVQVGSPLKNHQGMVKTGTASSPTACEKHCWTCTSTHQPYVFFLPIVNGHCHFNLTAELLVSLDPKSYRDQLKPCN